MGSSVPYFHRAETKRLIQDLAEIDEVTFYVGAGTTIERTGLTWNGLAAQLMTGSSWGDFSRRVNLAKSAGALTVSSAMELSFQKQFGPEWRHRLRQHIADELYRSADYTDSQGNYRRNTNLDGFNDTLVALSVKLMEKRARVAIVTPNYDDFLLASLDALSASNPEWFDDHSVEVFGCGVDDLGQAITVDLRALSKSVRSSSTLTIVYLHGYVDRPRDNFPIALPAVRNVDKSSLVHCYPVVSERDYAITQQNSLRVLEKLFRNRAVILLGTSISDAPLVDALVMSSSQTPSTRKPKESRRFAFSPLHSDLLLTNLDNVREVRRLRLAHLGVTYVDPDYFFQSRQLLEEWRAAVVHSGAEYSSIKSNYRYGARLSNWWQAWLNTPPNNLQTRQHADYLFLRDVMIPYVKSLLGLSASAESIRIEVWLRWQPEERKLRLWASSVGDWHDFQTMRSDDIFPASEYVTTQAFVNGAVTYDTSSNSRWESFLAIPLRYMDESTGLSLQVGAVGISSMSPPHASAINSAQKVKKTQLLRALDFAGTMVASPNHVALRYAEP